MKHTLSVVLVVLCVQASFAQLNVWRWQNPLPEGNLLLSVQMISLNAIYACGDNGTFMRTTDGGQAWDIQANLFGWAGSFNSLSFFDQNYGMCCGNSGKIIKTTDGGTTWAQLKSNTTIALNSIVVVDKNIALTITLGGGILKTTDGGNTWFAIPFEGTLSLYSIRMLRPDFLTITGYGGTLMKSVDTGRTWHNIHTAYGNTYFSASFTDDSTATIVAENGLILHTVNGVTWTKEQLDSMIIPTTLNGVDGKDHNTLAIVGDYGTILYTTNGGSLWNQSDIGTREHIKAVSFFDKENATAVGHDGVVLRTIDGGKDWFFLPHIPYTDILYSVAFPKGDTSLGLTCGYYGTILRTTNGGASWAVAQSGVGSSLRGICFADSMNAFAVGDFGVIIKSTDAGLSWNPVPSGTTKNLFAVSFATLNDGLAVGDNGTVLRTYLAGQFWTKEYVSSYADSDFFRTISFTDRNHAFMSGQSGYYISKDGGVNWIYTLQPDACFPLSFADSLHGGVLFGTDGNHYCIKLTSDGGLTWSNPQTLSTTPFGIHIVDPMHGTIVGRGGYISHMSDGKTFVDQQSNTLNTLVGVCFGTTHAGTAVGYRGNIMRITSDETLSSAQTASSGSQRITLDPNYPNPFSVSTTIRYYLPAGGFTTIEIFTIDGKLIATFDKAFESSGENEVKFDAMNLRAGAYICRLSSSGLSAEEKIIIDK